MERIYQTELKRKLTGEESIFFRTPEANVSLVAGLKGAVDETNLRLALTRVAQNHPLMRAHCIVDQDQDVWLVAAEACELPLKVISRNSDDHWKTAIQDEYRIPFDFEKGPLIRFVLLKSSELSELLIYCQHTICDGLSLSHLAEEILLFLSEPDREAKIEPNPLLPIPENFSVAARQNKLTGLVKRVVINRITNQWKKSRLVFDQDDFLSIQRAYFKKYRYEILVIELPDTYTQSLVDACRQNQVTVNSTISVAFLAGRQDVVNSYSNDRQTVAVSIRNRLKQPVENAFGCYVGDIGLRFGYRTDQSFWENVRTFHKRVRQAIDAGQDIQSVADLSWIDYGLMQAMTFARHIGNLPGEFDDHPKLSALSKNSKNIAVSLSKQGMSEYPGLLITNLGALKYPTQFGALELEKFYFVPSSIPLPDAGLIIGVVTLNQKMVITLNTVVPASEPGSSQIVLLNKIKDKTLERLSQAIGH